MTRTFGTPLRPGAIECVSSPSSMGHRESSRARVTWRALCVSASHAPPCVRPLTSLAREDTWFAWSMRGENRSYLPTHPSLATPARGAGSRGTRLSWRHPI